MSERDEEMPERIWAHGYEGRPAPPDRYWWDHGGFGTKYIRADLAAERDEEADRQRDAALQMTYELNDALERGRELVDALRSIHSYAFGDHPDDLDNEDALERIRIIAFRTLEARDGQGGKE